MVIAHVLLVSGPRASATLSYRKFSRRHSASASRCPPHVRRVDPHSAVMDGAQVGQVTGRYVLAAINLSLRIRTARTVLQQADIEQSAHAVGHKNAGRICSSIRITRSFTVAAIDLPDTRVDA